nr:MAG TPA: hypothetical protein [Caudoviricetes sp.]
MASQDMYLLSSESCQAGGSFCYCNYSVIIF